ncbi:MAG: hypothetical protein V3U98_11555 [Acidobacteriota bacterium]
MRNRIVARFLGTLVLAGVGAGLPAWGAESSIWRLDEFKPSTGGELEHVSLGWDGTLAIAPRQQTLVEWPSAQVWALARDSRGAIYAGTGSEGQVFMLGPGGTETLLFEAEEPMVQALAVDSRGRVIAATSPSGKVYRIEAPGEAQVLFDPPEMYIWALAWSRNGDLLVATGDPAVLYRVNEAGKAEEILRSEEKHFRCLAVGPAGDIYAGTAESAYVYRLGPGGEAYVLYDATGSEITALAVDAEGTLYAAALGGKARSAPEPSQPKGSEPEEPIEADVTVTVTASADEKESKPKPTTKKAGAQPKPRPGGGSRIYRIRPDGYPEQLWHTATQEIYTLAVDANGEVLAGVGEPAAVLRISAHGKAGQWAKLEGAQATDLLFLGDGVWAVATSNLGSVMRLGPGRAEQGTYTAPVKDAKIFSEWGRLRWEAEVPRGSDLELEVRSGNTKRPGETWSAWRTVSMKGQQAAIPSPPARFLQWRARLSADRGSTGPVLRLVEAYFRQRNVAPKVISVRLEDPGVVIQPVRRKTSSSQNQGSSTARRTSGAKQSKRRPPTRRTFEKGSQTVSWTAQDRNKDRLVFELYYRWEDSQRWILLEEDVTEQFYVFDTTSLPDGRYRIKVVARDTGANPPAEVLSGEAESDLFVIDNGPPQVRSLRAVVKGNAVELSFEVQDGISPVQAAEYALDGGEWTALHPVDGVADSNLERYRANVEVDTPGEHLLGVRASDEVGNRGADHVSFEIP